MMQNVSATDPRGISLEAEIRFTQYRLDTTSDIGSRSSALARMRLLQDVLTGLAPAPTPTASPAPSRADGGVRPTCETSCSEGKWPKFDSKGLNTTR
jgi:hypothetical protein